MLASLPCVPGLPKRVAALGTCPVRTAAFALCLLAAITPTANGEGNEVRLKNDQAQISRLLELAATATDRSKRRKSLLTLIEWPKHPLRGNKPIARVAGLNAARKLLQEQWAELDSNAASSPAPGGDALWLMDLLLKYDPSFKEEYIRRLRKWNSETQPPPGKAARLEFALRLAAVDEEFDQSVITPLQKEVAEQKAELKQRTEDEWVKRADTEIGKDLVRMRLKEAECFDDPFTHLKTTFKKFQEEGSFDDMGHNIAAAKRVLTKRSQTEPEFQDQIVAECCSAMTELPEQIAIHYVGCLTEPLGRTAPLRVPPIFRKAVHSEDVPKSVTREMILHVTLQFRPKDARTREEYDRELAGPLADLVVAGRGERPGILMALIEGNNSWMSIDPPIGREEGLKAIRSVLPMRCEKMEDSLTLASMWTKDTLWLMDLLLEYDPSFKDQYVQRLRKWVSSDELGFLATQRLDFAYRLKDIGETVDDAVIERLQGEAAKEEEKYKSREARREQSRQ